MDRVKVILNPHGGRLGGPAKRAVVEKALQHAGIVYDLVLGQNPAQASELARQAVGDGWPVVVAAGGDGTINRVLNGLIQAAGETEAGSLGIIPVGTANDLAYGLGLPLDPLAACQRLAAGHTRLLDVGQVNGHYFASNSAVGMEAMITLEHDRMRWLKGNLRYLVAALKCILAARSWQMRLSWGAGGYEGPVTLVSVGNSRRTGGSFFLTPNAVLDDGLLDFVYAMRLSRRNLVRLLPQTLTGRHIHDPQVVYRRTPGLSIVTSSPTPVHADGEIIDRAATEVNYRIIPGKLRVIV